MRKAARICIGPGNPWWRAISVIGLLDSLALRQPWYSWILVGREMLPVPTYVCLRGRYWIASARCAVSIPSLPARSAMVRDSFKMRW